MSKDRFIYILFSFQGLAQYMHAYTCNIKTNLLAVNAEYSYRATYSYSYTCNVHKYDKAFAFDLYLIYNRSPAARVCKSDTDRLLMLYLVLKNDSSYKFIGEVILKINVV
jgi:hypothetical protein